MKRDAFKAWLPSYKPHWSDSTRKTVLSDAKALNADLGNLDAAYDQDRLYGLTLFVETVTREESARQKKNGKHRDIARSRGAYRDALKAYSAFRAREADNGGAPRHRRPVSGRDDTSHWNGLVTTTVKRRR
jgi:hypothetical protein